MHIIFVCSRETHICKTIVWSILVTIIGVVGSVCYSMTKWGICLLAVQELIKYLSSISPAHIYATAMSPPAVQQVISAFKVILGEDGTDRGKILSWTMVTVTQLWWILVCLFLIVLTFNLLLQGPGSLHRYGRIVISLELSWGGRGSKSLVTWIPL